MYKRFEIRRSIGIPVEVISSLWDDPIELNASDLSPRGAYVESEFLPQAGEHVVCSFDVSKTGAPYCFFGEITRVNLLRRKVDRGRPGFGIRFLDAAPLDRLQIRRSLRYLPPPIPNLRREGGILYSPHNSH